MSESDAVREAAERLHDAIKEHKTKTPVAVLLSAIDLLDLLFRHDASVAAMSMLESALPPLAAPKCATPYQGQSPDAERCHWCGGDRASHAAPAGRVL